MDIKRRRSLFLLLVLFTIVSVLMTQVYAQSQADAPTLRADHPDEYVVQEGDTLWDISSRFLIRPWEWPAIWMANPDIDNPHLIFPGDVLNLSVLNGRPVLQVVRRSPEMRVVDDAISAIAFDDLKGYLQFPRLIADEDIEDLPYIVGTEQDRIHAALNDLVYVRYLDADVGTEVKVAQRNYVYQLSGEDLNGDTYVRRFKIPAYPGYTHREYNRRDSLFLRGLKSIADDKERPVLGHELWEAATAVVLKVGEVSVLRIIDGRREVGAGDFILPLDDYVYDPEFFPRAMQSIPEGRVVGLRDIEPYAAHQNVVMLDIGSDHGVEPGHVFSAFRPGQTIADPVKGPRGSFRRVFGSSEKVNVDLPDELTGRMMVFRSYPHISYALIMGGRREVGVGDVLAHPDRSY